MADFAANRMKASASRLVSDNIGFGFLTPHLGWEYRLDNNELLATSIVDNEFAHLNDPARNLFRQEGSSTYDALIDSWTVTVNDDIGAHGEILHSITDVGNGLENTTVTHVYGAFGPSASVDPSVPNRETDRTVLRLRLGSPPVGDHETWSYYPATGALNEHTVYPGLANERTTAYTYTACGNVATTDIRLPGQGPSDWKRETFSYEQPAARFVDKHKVWCSAPISAWIEEKSSTDARWGKVRNHTGFDRLMTEQDYDGWGRLRWKSAPHALNQPRYNVDYAYEWAVDQSMSSVHKVTTLDPSGPDASEWFDLLGRSVRTGAVTTFGTTTSTKTYHWFGALSEETSPHYEEEEFVTLRHFFDEYRRPLADESNLAGTTFYDYSFGPGEAIVTTIGPAPAYHTTVKHTDAAGRLIYAGDAGGMLEYAYDSRGNVIIVARQGDALEHVTYDAFGHRTMLTDMDGGTTHYVHDPFGRLKWQQDPNGNETAYTYDNHDRPLSRTEPEGTTTYKYYFDQGVFMDEPVQITSPGVVLSYEYTDPLLRCTKERRDYNGNLFITRYTHDPVYDRMTHKQYPNGFDVSYTYFPEGGELAKVNHNGAAIFDASHINGQGQYDQYKKGDGQETNIHYLHGYPLAMETPGVLDLHNKFDYTTGNLLARWDNTVGRGEEFTYDFLDRLTGATVNTVGPDGVPITGIAHHDYEYDGQQFNTKGNLVRKSDVGVFGYGNSHGAVANARGAVYGTPPAVINHLPTQDIAYTSYSKTRSMDEVVNGVPYHQEYRYGPDHQRYQSVLQANNSVHTDRWYAGDFERQYHQPTGSTADICYIDGGDGLTAMAVRVNGGAHKIYYVYKDQLGSILALTHADGQFNGVAARQNFDPWGRKRDPQTWTYDNVPNVPAWLYRGYTGHEHVDAFALINMNGRMYDPLNGRMLGIDRFVQGFTNSQGYNRYAYCGNNPMKYTDPTGDYWFLPMVIGFAVNYISAATRTEDWVQTIFTHGIPGAIFAGASYGIGMTASGFAASTLGMSAGGAAFFGSVAGGMGSGAASAVTIGNGDVGMGLAVGFGSGLLGGALSRIKVENFWLEGAINATAGGLYGGAVAKWMGGSFADGAATGFIASTVGWAVNRASIKQITKAEELSANQGYVEDKIRSDAEYKAAESKRWIDPDNMRHFDMSYWDEFSALSNKTLGSNFNGRLSQNFDLVSKTIKFGLLHLRSDGTYHYDRYNIVRAPIRHIIFDTLWQWWRYGTK